VIDTNSVLYYNGYNRPLQKLNGDVDVKIRSMHLEHYRCFDNFDIDFDDRLTVLVGVNGVGKTAVLDAVSVFLKWAGHPNRESEYCRIPVADIAIGHKPEDIVYRLEVLNHVGAAEDSEPMDMRYSKTSFDYLLFFQPEAFKNIKQVLDAQKPVFAAYMAGRFINEKDSVLTQNNSTLPAHVAFENSFKRTIDFASTLTWFNIADADEARAIRDSGLESEMPELKAVREALSKALLGQYERPRMLGNPPELIIYKKDADQYYKVSQLSDGYRAMLALVMDLARRMAQSQGDDSKPGESLLQTPAIVLIDEIELHLHPSWQQTVLTTLMEIFPNTQFIVSTHSPQILTSIPPKHIRVLSDGKAYTVSGQTQGAEASRLLKRVFGVEPRPKYLEIVQALNDYSKLVYDEQWDTPEAEKLKKKLTDHYGNDEPELMALDLHIENSKWESGI